MHENSDTPTTIPAPGRDVLTEILRAGARRLPGQAIETEVDACIKQHARIRADSLPRVHSPEQEPAISSKQECPS